MSADGPLPKLPWNIYAYTATASLSSLVYGYNTGIIASAIIFIPNSFPLTTTQTGVVVSAILLGAAIGSLLSGILADMIGRKNALAWNNLFMLIAAVMTALGDSSTLLMLSRLVLGIGVGVASVIPTLYLTELAPSHIRGRLGAYNQLNGWLGIVISYFVGYGIFKCTAGDTCWRYMFASGALLCIFHWIMVVSSLPESPRWLVSRGRCKDALAVLGKIYGEQHESYIIREYQTICERQDYQEPCCLSWGDIFDSKYRRPLTVALAMQIFQQCSGNGVILYYSALLFASIGYGERMALLYNAITCIPQMIILVYVVFSLDRHGRKAALMLSQAGIALSLLLLGLASLPALEGSHLWIFITGVIAHRAFFACGLGPVPAILISESLPFAIRGRGLALALALNWLLNFLIAASFPLLFEVLPSAYIYWAFAILALLALLFTNSSFVEETKGVSLEQIEHLDNTFTSGIATNPMSSPTGILLPPPTSPLATFPSPIIMAPMGG